MKFGDYIHKCFYDKSIADGYTLRIKKEQIDTTAKAEIRENLDIENQDLNSKDVYESNDYIESISKYIEKDFRQFRFVNTDDSIGGMIVCRSNPQAKAIHKWFKAHSKISTGLVLSDSKNNAVQGEINEQNQINFRENGYHDILVVHFMLTTGYDVKRLKKMYFLRGPSKNENDYLEAFYDTYPQDVAFAYEDTIDYLVGNVGDSDFYKQSDKTLTRISNYPQNSSFSVETSKGKRKPLFTPITGFFKPTKRNAFIKNIFSYITRDRFDFGATIKGSYDFFSTIFEY